MFLAIFGLFWSTVAEMLAGRQKIIAMTAQHGLLTLQLQVQTDILEINFNKVYMNILEHQDIYINLLEGFIIVVII